MLIILVLVHSNKNLFDFVVEKSDGSSFSLSELKGKKAFLIVNVATYCGFTETHMKELTALDELYREDGFEILAFPCNDFGNQEPGSNQEIQEFCKAKGATYNVYGKLKCSGGPNIHPLYQWLTSNMPQGERPGQRQRPGEGITWNFNKFLLNADGEITRFEPANVHAMEMEPSIRDLILPPSDL